MFWSITAHRPKSERDTHGVTLVGSCELSVHSPNPGDRRIFKVRHWLKHVIDQCWFSTCEQFLDRLINYKSIINMVTLKVKKMPKLGRCVLCVRSGLDERPYPNDMLLFMCEPHSMQASDARIRIRVHRIGVSDTRIGRSAGLEYAVSVGRHCKRKLHIM